MSGRPSPGPAPGPDLSPAAALRRGGRPGTGAWADVPGSSANLGPGFDAVGLALGLRDELTVRVLPPSEPTHVEVVGEGAGRVGSGEDHLVVRSLRAALARVGAPQPALAMTCRNRVPSGRGVGSSAAAVVAGVVLARGLLDEPDRLDDDVALDVAAGLEGHADNAAASLLGAATLGWAEPEGYRAVRLEPHPDVVAVLVVPDSELLTARARAMLPATVPHADAAFTAGRAALLAEALSRRPDLLLPATADRLHQAQRAGAMPATARLVADLREHGLAAVVSGAGPSVLVLGAGAGTLERSTERAHRDGAAWQVLDPGVDLAGALWGARDG